MEIRFHGRGGQGAVIASEMLASAAFLDGKQPQSFPFFGVERRGAPVTAYARIDDRPIGVRTSITRPDIVVVLQPNLLDSVPVCDGLKPGGLLLVNSKKAPEELAAPPRVRRATIDANEIAVAHHLGSVTAPIVNTTILGALAKASGAVSIGSIVQAIEHGVPVAVGENQRAAEDGFAKVRLAPPPSGALVMTAGPARAPTPLEIPGGPVATVPSSTLKTASWRTLRPEIHLEHCTRCNFCWKYCPDDAIEFDPQGYPVLRAQYCKGCGICAAECPPKVIDMVAEG